MRGFGAPEAIAGQARSHAPRDGAIDHTNETGRISGLFRDQHLTQ